MCTNLLKPNSNELGICWPKLTEERITVCCTNDGMVCISTFQEGEHHFFSLTPEQADHISELLRTAATTSNQPPDAA